MSIFRKLNTLLRAGIRESAEVVTDANAIRIYRQEVVDAENLLARRKTGLAGMIASRRDLEHEIALAEKRIAHREEQIRELTPEQRSEDLLVLAARDIAATEAHLGELRRRHISVTERIDQEEITLRKLLSEIREHRREVKILQSQLARGGGNLSPGCRATVAEHLATLSQTRADITGAVKDIDTAEASMNEAVERVEGDAIERELSRTGQDRQSRHVDEVLVRLKGLGSAA